MNIEEEIKDHRRPTAVERRFVRELGIDRDKFFESQLHNNRAGYFIIERSQIDPDKSVSSQIDGLELSMNLRFGNYMWTLSNLLILAKKLMVTKIFLPKHPLLREDFTVDGIRFVQGEPKLENTLKGVFWYREAFASLLSTSVAPIELFHVFRSALSLLSGPSSVGTIKKKVRTWAKSITKRFTKELTIHIRSGDVFKVAKPNPGYWQPPLSFYIQVIESAKPTRVSIVVEDEANPIVSRVIEFLRQRGTRFVIHQGELEDAITELITARHLVGGRGSFLAPIIAMNKNVRRLSIFGDERFGQLPSVVLRRIRFNYHPAEDYESLVSPWGNTVEQRKAMLEWEPLRRGN